MSIAQVTETPTTPVVQDPIDPGLLPKLLDAGISNEQSRSILRQVSENVNASERYIATTGDYRTESIIGADPLNPFTLDNRYLTVFKLTVSNQGNLMKEFCLPTMRLHSDTDVYEPFEKENLLHTVPYGTVNFEVLNQLLVAPCTVLPPQTTIDRYITFPSVRYNAQYRLTAQTNNQMNSVRYSVKRSTSFERFVFSPARIQVKETDVTATTIPTSTPGVSTYNEVMRTSFIFLKSDDDVTRVDNKEHLLQETMEPGTYQIILIRRQKDVYSVTLLPLDPSRLVDGVIRVEVE